jgi:aryl-alcohol dehydrogenase-like predicted oxidoreductase
MMRTRLLGPDAPPVSVVGFGGMPLSIPGRPEDESAAIRVIHTALDGGVTLIDTADAYALGENDVGHNERLAAKALRQWKGPREGVIVATKGGIERHGTDWTLNGRPAYLRKACDRSLKALGVERIDLYQYHRPDPGVPLLESVGALADLERAGKVRWIGLSNVDVDEIESARTVMPVTTVQNRLNPFFREALERGVVEHCGREGIGFLAYSPVGGGRLNKKLPTHPTLLPIARRHACSPHAVVLAWVLAQGSSVIVIPGARTVEHAADALTAAAVDLSDEDRDAIDRAEFSRA